MTGPEKRTTREELEIFSELRRGGYSVAECLDLLQDGIDYQSAKELVAIIAMRERS